MLLQTIRRPRFNPLTDRDPDTKTIVELKAQRSLDVP